MPNRTPALVHEGGPCGCPAGTPVIFRITKPGFVCTRCFQPYLEAVVTEVDWPIEIHGSKIGASLALQDELVKQSARALAVAEVVGIGGRVFFFKGTMTSTSNTPLALDGHYTKSVL